MKHAADEVTERLDRLYAVEESRLDPALHRAQRESLGGEAWSVPGDAPMRFQIEVEREDGGRWIAEVPELPGVMAYGEDHASAVARVQALALRVLRERMESGSEDAGAAVSA